MLVSQAVLARRAVKHFDPNYDVPDDVVKDILRQAMLSPTAFNIQHWRFVWVKDPARKQKIREVAWNQEKITDASTLFVMTADLKAWEKSPARYWQDAPQPVVDFILPAIDAYYRGKPQVERDECMRSMGLAAMTIMLAAKEHGLDTCPMDGFDFDAVAKLVNLPDDHVVGLMISLGKKTKDAWERVGRLPFDDVVVIDQFA